MDLELLAPAGSAAGLKAVIAAGADAVYIGGSRYGARAFAENPGEEELIACIRYAHLRGVRVYLTVNTLLRDEELSELPAWLSPYVEAGLDAVLVQDLGVLRLLRREFPRLTIHASTQMSVTGPEGAMLLRKLGVSRVVPAREMSLSELSGIASGSGLEVEAFVHGALCVCFSGQCLFSSLLGGRSGNRGRCAQPCRLPYRMGEERGELLSPRDLCALDLLPQMAEAGVVSFKIEGRMKQPAYAAGVVSVYRKYLDLLASGKPYRVDPADRRRLYDLFNRGGFTDGYFTRRNGPEMMTREGRALSRKEEEGRARLYAAMDEKYVLSEDALDVLGEAKILAGRRAELSLTLSEQRRALAPLDADICVSVLGGEVLQAKNAPLGEERIAQQLSKTGGSGFVFRGLKIVTDGQSFLPAKSLNDLRRQAFAALTEEILRRYPALKAPEEPLPEGLEEPSEGGASAEKIGVEAPNAGIGEKIGVKAQVGESSDKIGVEAPAAGSGEEIGAEVRGLFVTALCDTVPQARAALKAGADRVYLDAAAVFEKRGGRDFLKNARNLLAETGRKGSLWLATPLAERGTEASPLYENARTLLKEGLGGFLVRSLEGLSHMERLGLAGRCLADAPVYTWNREARAFLMELGFLGDTAPYELSRAQLGRRGGDLVLSKTEFAGRSEGGIVSEAETGDQFAASPEEEMFSSPSSGPDGVKTEAEGRRAHVYEGEVQIYGRQTLMVTAQCLRKNTRGCTGVPGVETLTDRMGAAFPVRCNCVFCSNIIYNSVPHALFREAGFLRRAGFSALRLAFTVESPGEAGRLTLAARSLSGEDPRTESPEGTGGKDKDAGERASGRKKKNRKPGEAAFAEQGEPVTQYTRGQFARGVE